jgi:hypothetical protein
MNQLVRKRMYLETKVLNLLIACDVNTHHRISEWIKTHRLIFDINFCESISV